MVKRFRVLRQSFCGKLRFSADFPIQLIQFFGCIPEMVTKWSTSGYQVVTKWSHKVRLFGVISENCKILPIIVLFRMAK